MEHMLAGYILALMQNAMAKPDCPILFKGIHAVADCRENFQPLFTIELESGRCFTVTITEDKINEDHLRRQTPTG